MKLILLQLVVEHMRVGQNSHWGKALTGVKLSWGKAFTGVKLSFSLYSYKRYAYKKNMY